MQRDQSKSAVFSQSMPPDFNQSSVSNANNFEKEEKFDPFKNKFSKESIDYFNQQIDG